MYNVYNEFMRYLGIDYGRKRIGIALSDSGGRIAFPKTTLRNQGNHFLWQQLKELIEKEGVSRIVVGIPLGLDMSETETSKMVRKFADDLKKITPLPIEFENEVLTSHMVEKAGVKKEHTDEAAAALILQSYLDKSRNSKIRNKDE